MSLLTCSYFRPINKEYSSTIFALLHILMQTPQFYIGQTVQNYLHGKLRAIFFWNTVYLLASDVQKYTEQLFGRKFMSRTAESSF